jgi:hypothetical protein
VESKKGFLFMNGSIQDSRLDSLKVPVLPANRFFIDPINAGILSNKKQSVEVLLTVTNIHNFSIFIEEIELNSKYKTITLRKIDNLTN